MIECPLGTFIVGLARAEAKERTGEKREIVYFLSNARRSVAIGKFRSTNVTYRYSRPSSDPVYL